MVDMSAAGYFPSLYVTGLQQVQAKKCDCTLGYNDLNNLVFPGRWWLQNLILRHIDTKKSFQFFQPYAVKKGANIT